MNKKEFVSWCKVVYSKQTDIRTEAIKYADDGNPLGDNTKHARDANSLRGQVRGAVRDNLRPSIHFVRLAEESRFSFDYASKENPIAIRVGEEVKSDVCLSDGFYESITVLPNKNERQLVSINNCHIATLILSGKATVLVSDSSIGSLRLANSRNIHIKGSEVYSIDVLNTEFHTGDMSINSTYLPTKTKDKTGKSLLDNFKVYSDLRKMMYERGNILLANRFQSLEIKSSRQYESWSQKPFSWIYELVSDYGTSFIRPLILFLILFVGTMFIACAEDAAIPQQKDDFYQGWQVAVLSSDKKLVRAALLTAQSIVNPGGVISTKNLVVAKQGTFTSKWLWAYSLLSILLVALFIFALRRRFRIQY